MTRNFYRINLTGFFFCFFLLAFLSFHSTAYPAADTTAPAGMVFIPAGSFQMGDAIDHYYWETPVHTVTLSAFYLDKYEVTWSLWKEVKAWAGGHGYGFSYHVPGTAADHPVENVNLFDVIKWMNARSEKEGRTPVYYTDVAQTTIYKTGSEGVSVKWTANGYRLPTEAEWEYAARAGTTTRFYTGDCISADTQANYWHDPLGYSAFGCHEGDWPNRNATIAVGQFPANPWGLFDMAGNVSEWTWDSYGEYSSSAVTNPKMGSGGLGGLRVIRGGSWNDFSDYLRSAARDYHHTSDYYSSDLGFRSVLNFATADPCTYTISPTISPFSSSGNTGMVIVTTSSSRCSWTAVSKASWITVTSGSSGTGSGTVSYSIAANTTGSNRTGTITIAGNTFTITQKKMDGLSWLLLLLGN